MSNELVIENCIKIKQNDLSLYTFILTAEEIHNNFVVSRRYEDREEGYQRILKPNKAKKIVSYLSGKTQNASPAILPNTILIALDNIEYDEKHKRIIIKNNSDSYKGLIIDGQHRAKGSYDYNSNFQLVVIGVEGLNSKEQARLFTTINKTQTSLPTSLYLDLITSSLDTDIRDSLDSESITIEQKATELIKDINANEDSTLQNMIALTGEERGKINLAQCVTLIKPYINYTNGKFKTYSYMQQLKVFINFFNAIKVVFENEWKNGQVFKTTIFGGLFKSIIGIFDETYIRHHNFKENSVIDVLSQIKDLSLTNLADNVGGGVKAQENFSKHLVKELKNKIKSDKNFGNIDL